MSCESGARALPAFGASLLAACAGNGAGLDANGQPVGAGGGGPPPPLTVDFQSIQDNISTPICTSWAPRSTTTTRPPPAAGAPPAARD